MTTETLTELGVLTSRQRQVLEFLCDHHVAVGRPPTIREIIEHLGINRSCVNAVQNHLQQLRDKGYVKQEFSRAGAIRVIVPSGPGWVRFPGAVWLRLEQAREAVRDVTRQLVEAAAAEGPSVARPS